MSKVLCQKTLFCHTPRPKIWSFLTDTNRLNWSVGMNKLNLTPLSDDSAARYLAETKLGGFSVLFEEQPYEWVLLQKFKVRRPMRRGPLKALTMGFKLADGRTGGTQVTLSLILEPRYFFIVPVAKINGMLSLWRFARQLQTYDTRADGDRTVTPVTHKIANEPGLRKALMTLAETEPLSLCKGLEDMLRAATPLQLARLKPFQLADLWGSERAAVLRMCLRAASIGLLDLRWEVICPSCRVATTTVKSLADLQAHGMCQLCDIRFAASTRESLEVVFRPVQSLRPVEEGAFCIGGPALTPHVLTQSIVPAHGETSLACPLVPGKYRLFVRGGTTVPILVDPRGQAHATFELSQLRSLAELTMQPGSRLALSNHGKASVHAKIEQRDWVRQSATLRDVELLPSYKAPARASGAAAVH